MQMNEWIKQFQLENNHLLGPFFYGTPLALRFEIGPSGEMSHPLYLDRAYERAIRLLEQASSNYDYLLLSLLREEDRNVEVSLRHFTSRFGFEAPPQPELFEIVGPVGELLIFERYLFPISTQNLKDIIKEIVWADFGGFAYLSASVLLLSTCDNVIYHCYDDRGVDIAVLNHQKRYELFHGCHDLLFDYDMEEMMRRMDSNM
ncbi:hypothetical protein GUT184_14050 [Streptococcus ruminantium]|nr:hypothetical protein GUT184_14050 [Streptococcus ruminantium]